MMLVHNDHDVLMLARTLWGEARGEPAEGQTAVAWVICNRAARGRFAGRLFKQEGAVAYVCLVPRQFSCWNEGDPNRIKLLVLGEDQFLDQVAIASNVLDGLVADPTDGADHYHTIEPPAGTEVWPPDWAETMRETARFGGHVFYDSRPAQ
jgi:N-acetylmuramoyl-L-alanine amidase